MNMPSDSESTVRGRELGNAIRLAIERAKLTGKRTAELLDWSESKVSRILTGHLPPSEVEVAALLALCGVVGERRDHLLDLCRDQALYNWSTDRLAVAKHQQAALRLTEFHNSLVPPLLQIEGYARSVASRMVNLEGDDIESWTDMRQRARAVFERVTPKAPPCFFFMHQIALDLPVGSHEIMSEQLHYMLQIGVRRNVTIRLISTSMGAYHGSCGPFSYMEFSDFRPVVYVEDEVDGHFIEEPTKVANYQRLIAALSAICLDKDESATIILAKAESYGKRSKARHTTRRK